MVAIGESLAGASFQELDHLGLVLRWLADSEYDVRRGLPPSKRLPISAGGCTRDGMILGDGGSFSVDLPKNLGRSLLTFWAAILSGSSDISASVSVDGGVDASWTRVADKAVPPTGGWFHIEVDTGLFPRGTEEIRLRVSGVNVLVGIAEPLLIPKEHSSEKLNLVLVDLDTVRADRLGCYGYNTRPTSVRLDSLIETKGFALFEHAYAPSPWTLSSTAKFFASRYRHEELRNNTSSVLDETPLLAEILRKNGYYCAAFTGGAVLRTPGFERGFHEYHWSRSYGKVEDSFPQASRWLRSSVEPFFLFLHTYEAHSPYTRTAFCRDLGLDLPDIKMASIARGNSISRQESLCVQALYDGGVKTACDATADFFALMDTLDLWQRTVVVVLSDHGEELWEHFGIFARHGHSLYDELLEVPFLIYSPGNDGKRRISERVSLVDLVPTVAELLELNWSGVADGLSLVPLMRGRSAGKRTIVATLSNGAPWGGACLYTDTHKYIEMFRKDSPDRSRTFDSLCFEPGRELYALASDPVESANLATVNPAAAESFSDTLRSTLAGLLPPLRSGTDIDAGGLRSTLEQQLRALGYAD
jgi:arylsulfatase A-like enzyme